MANAFAGNRLIIDTAGATLLFGALAQHVILPVSIKGIRWVGSDTNAHQAVIQDTNSVVVWEAIETTATLGRPQESLLPLVLVTDIKVTTLDSGILYIYLNL